MKRRTFMKLGALGGAATALCLSASRGSASNDTQFALTIYPANAEMIDGTIVYVLNYFLYDNEARPEIRVTEGDQITVSVTNYDVEIHGFSIPGIPQATIAAIEPGATATIDFTAPPGGSYIYIDPYKDPLNRLLGLYGAFIAEPINGKTPAGAETPFSQAQQTPQVQAVFDALGGGHRRFPGEKWRSGDLRREKLWIFSQTDPLLNERIAAGELVDPGGVKKNFLPRYFTINGLSGFDTSVHDSAHGGSSSPAERIMPSGKQGEPCLLRTMNAGLATHAVHIHGNHCFQLAEAGLEDLNYCETHAYERDVWQLSPLQRIDMLLPFERPPDIPIAAWPPRDEPFPLRYVMHCHFELSQTAGGGNYPQGAVTHWEMTAPL